MLLLLCSYPAFASKYLPIGLYLRDVWMALLVLGPLAYLVYFGRGQGAALRQESLHWLKPWVPFLIAYAVAALWHANTFGLVSIQGSRLLYGVLIYACARLIGVRWQQLRVAAIGACILYGGLALYEGFNLTWPTPGESNLIPWEWRLTGGRVGLLANPNALSSMVMWLIGLILTSHWMTPNNEKKHGAWVALALVGGLTACWLTQSRGPMLGVLPMIVITVVFLPKPQRYWVAALAVALVVIGGVTLQVVAPEHRFFSLYTEIQRHLNHQTGWDDSIAPRLHMWMAVEQATHIWPWLGPGTSNVADLSYAVQAGPMPPGYENHTHVHSDLPQTFVNGGSLLLLGHLVTLGLLFKQAGRNPVLLWLILGAITFGLTDRIFHENNLFGFFVVTWALYSAAFDNQSANKNKPN